MNISTSRHSLSRSLSALAILAAMLGVAACRSPLLQERAKADMTLSFTVAGSRPSLGASASVAQADGSSRLILPTVASLLVTLTPEQADVTAPDPIVAPLPEPGQACDVTFMKIVIGRYTITAEAKNAAGAVLFRRSAVVELSSDAAPIPLTLVPVSADGSSLASLSTGTASAGELAPGQSMTWTIPSSGTAYVLLTASSDVQLFCQGGDGENLNDDPLSRRAKGTIRSDASGFATVYNAGAASQPYSLSFNDAPLIAQWKLDFCNGDDGDYVDSIGAMAAMPVGSMYSNPTGSGCRSKGSLHLYDSSYLSIPATPYAELAAPWSVMAWVSHSQIERVQPLLSGTSGNAIYVAKDLGYQVAVSMGGATYPFAATVDSEGAWTHVAIVNTGSELRLYLNGIQAGPAIVDPAAVAMKLPFSRVGSDGAVDYYRGYYDDIRVYQDAIAGSDIATIQAMTARELTVSSGAHGSVSVSPEKDYYDIGETVTLTAVPADATWKFDGWSGSASGASLTATLVMDADKSVGAAFSTAVPRFAFSYDYNGGTFVGGDGFATGAPSGSSDLVQGSAITVDSSGYRITNPTYPALYFTGWNTKPDGSGVTYWPGDAATIGTTNLVLYTNWKADDAPESAARASAAEISPTSSTRGYIQYNGDMDYYKLIAAESGTITVSVGGVLPGLFTAFIANEDLSGYAGTGWNLDNTCIAATKNVSAGLTYYVYVGHQSQAYHNGAARVGVYTVTTTFTP